MMHAAHRRIRSWSFAVTLLVVAACTPAPPGPLATPTAVPVAHVVVSYSEMSTSPLPLWTAVDNGLFAKHGIEIESIYIPSTTGVAGLLSGSTSVAFMGGSDILGAVTDGADLVILACAVAVYPY